ncbi:MAG: amidohydrolase family protein [Steroidobacteraceae bacterium]
MSPFLFPRLLAFIALTSLSATVAIAGETKRYEVILVGNEVGEQIVSRTADGAQDVAYSYNDRGRGPDTHASFRLDDRGIPQAISITGVDYMKGEVRESFERKAGVSRWNSGADSGSSGPADFYLPLDGPPESVAILARALLAAEGHRLALLPSGEARIEEIESLELPGGRRIRHMAIHGLGFEARPMWLNADGSLYASIDSWMTVVEKGETANVENLRARQHEYRAARFSAMAREIRDVPDGPVLIDNARILDIRTGGVRTENAVLVEGERIVALLAPGAERPKAARIVDAAGRTLMPGLWDMHTHLDLIDGPLHIAAGVTTVRDLANDHDQLMSFVQQFDGGTAIGPRIFRAGFIDGPGPFAGPTRALVATEAEAATWVDFYAAHGYQQIKVYSSLDTGLVPFIAKRAHGHGLRLSGHIPAGMWAEDAVRAGFDEIQHINMVFLNFYKDVTETRNRDRFIKVAERGADLDLESEQFQRFIALLKERGTVVDPTVAIFFDLFTQVPGEPAASIAAIYDRLPALVARGTLKGGLVPPPGEAARYAQSARRMLDVIRTLHEAGIPLVAGTDALSGFALHAELELYARAGIPASEVLKIATIGAARVAGVDSEVGAVEPGMRADLILVQGRPDRDISAIRQVDCVMKAGVMHDAAAIYRAIGVRPRESAGNCGES